jgi:putative ABC transport system substrate-binding protein
VLDYKEMQSAARSLRLELQSIEVCQAEDLDGASSLVTARHAQALVVPAASVISFANRGRIASFAQRNRLPSMYPVKEFVEVGGLMCYGPSTADMSRRAAIYVDRILKGARPAKLPVERPTKFDLVINMKTARALGLTIPPSLLARAAQVIQ